MAGEVPYRTIAKWLPRPEEELFFPGLSLARPAGFHPQLLEFREASVVHVFRGGTVPHVALSIINVTNIRILTPLQAVWKP